jgi:hypothetical protein
MKEQPTPETDALVSVGLENADRECVPAEFGRKLERERDEALMDRDDEDIATMTRNHYERILKERDEACAVAGELADVASKHLSFLLAVTPAKTNETHEKETMRVIDAIKRWKKL